MNSQKINILLIKIDRIAAWILLFAIALYFLSGYGITKGIISTGWSYLMHKNLLPIISITTFSIHSFLGIRLSLMRNKVWNKITGSILSLVYLAIFIFFAYIEILYKPTTVSNKTVGAVPQDTERVLNLELNAKEVNSEKVFNASELAKYDGKDGNPSYVAVDGIVYDMSSVFKNGTHYGHNAGQELTEGFYAKHIKSQITKYPKVGTYSEK